MWAGGGWNCSPRIKQKPTALREFAIQHKTQQGKEIQTQQVDFASVTQRNRYGCLAGIYAKRKNAPTGAF